MPLLDPSIVASDDDYKALCPPTEFEEERQWLESLWTRYQPLADPNFRSAMASRFHERFWEMYLGCTLLDQGWELKSDSKGPDFCVIGPDEPVWIEAIAAGAGIGPDAVVRGAPGQAHEIPDEKVILRYRSAIEEKYRKRKGYLEKGLVQPEDPYVIALNGGSVPYHQKEDRLPRVVSAVLPFGRYEMLIDRGSGRLVGGRYGYRELVRKQSGAPVTTTVFQDPEYAGISAVLFSTASIWQFERTLGQIQCVVHNPHADNPLPHDWVSLGTSYYVENDELRGRCFGAPEA